MKYLRSTTLGYKDIEIRKSESDVCHFGLAVWEAIASKHIYKYIYLYVYCKERLKKIRMTFSWRVFLVKYYIFGASFLQSAYSDFGFSKRIQVFIYHFLFKGLVAKIQDCIARLTTVPLKLCLMKCELYIDFIILKTNYISYLGLYLLGLYCYSLRAII